MKFNIVRSTFIEGLKAVQNIVAAKNAYPILQNVLLEANGEDLKLTTTDLDLSIVCTVKCEVKEPGSSTLPVKLLANSVLKAPEGVIEVEIDEQEKGKLLAGSSIFRIIGKPAADFPLFTIDEESCEYTLPRVALYEMLRKTQYAASQDDTRRTLKGVLISFKDGKLTMVATDGRRLAMVEKEMEFPKNYEKDYILPSKTVQELMRSVSGEGDVVIKAQPTKICFEFDGTRILSKLVDEVYPNYTQVIPSACANKVEIDRQLLINALDRASVITMDEAHSTKLIFEGNRLVVTSAASEIGEAKDEVPIKYAGEKIEILFDPNFLMEPLKAIDDDEIFIEFNDGKSPAMIKCSIPFLYVVMPLRIS